MTNEIVAVISLVGSTVITTVVGLIVKKAVEKRLKDNQELIDLKEERAQRKRNEEIELTIKKEIVPLKESVEYIGKKVDLISNGTLSSLRNDILTCYYRCREKGYRNDYDYQNIHDLYEAYQELHGNSFITDIMCRFDALPTKEEVKDIDVHLVKRTSKKVLNENREEK